MFLTRLISPQVNGRQDFFGSGQINFRKPEIGFSIFPSRCRSKHTIILLAIFRAGRLRK